LSKLPKTYQQIRQKNLERKIEREIIENEQAETIHTNFVIEKKIDLNTLYTITPFKRTIPDPYIDIVQHNRISVTEKKKSNKKSNAQKIKNSNERVIKKLFADSKKKNVNEIKTVLISAAKKDCLFSSSSMTSTKPADAIQSNTKGIKKIMGGGSKPTPGKIFIENGEVRVMKPAPVNLTLALSTPSSITKPLPLLSARFPSALFPIPRVLHSQFSQYPCDNPRAKSVRISMGVSGAELLSPISPCVGHFVVGPQILPAPQLPTPLVLPPPLVPALSQHSSSRSIALLSEGNDDYLFGASSDESFDPNADEDEAQRKAVDVEGSWEDSEGEEEEGE